jgi:iron-sulfur cluster assembly protein
MLDFTQDAIDEIAKQIAKRGVSETKLRIGIRGGGCSGFSYVVEFHDGPPDEHDQLFDRVATDGTYATVLVDKKSLALLQGTTLEWESTLLRRGFKFVNPNVKSTCGCGSSFSA